MYSIGFDENNKIIVATFSGSLNKIEPLKYIESLLAIKNLPENLKILQDFTNTNYDLNVGTNAANGATVRVEENQDMTSGGNTISDIVEDTGGAVTAGVEEYGVQVDADVGSWTEQGDFTDDDTPIPGSTTAVASTGGPLASTGDDVTITHKIAVASSTDAGNYTHTVTWTVIADF